jgi:aspartyl-tRNA(Asn)/glutamyl-tRNA(Gln) amidotransferase subunit B
MEYEMIIGIEIHAELSTKSKIFCSCTTTFGGEPNTQICPICTGMPGTLPVLNKKVVEFAVKAGLATHCEISSFSKQDRKNYFYPDLPKAYQVSQYDLPLCKNGYVNIEVEGTSKRIGITRIHIEEDAGKLNHGEDGSSLVDYNRCGVPLIEIVSEPDMSSPEDAKAYVEKIKSILEYIEVSDCKMQEGSLRADINLSVRPKGHFKLGTRTETKNLNSFRSIVRSIQHEAERQIQEIASGKEIIQETRRWDDEKSRGFSMRSKEEAHDYRYFPEPDLTPIVLDQGFVDKLLKELPELPDERKKRYIKEYQLPPYDAEILTASKDIADFFEEAMEKSNNPKGISNWIMGDLLKLLNDKKEGESPSIPFPGIFLAELVDSIDHGKISGTIAKKVFQKMFLTGKRPGSIIEDENLAVISDPSILSEIIDQVLQKNPKSIEDFKGGKEKAFGFLVGQSMAATRGKGDPVMVNTLLRKKLTEN